jgi:hypothetical protein
MLVRQFTGETLARLETLAAMLDEGQLSQVFARVGADNAALDRVLLEGFQTDMFACQEDMDINSPAGAAAVSARLQSEFGWPKSLTDVYEGVVNATFFDVCKEFVPQPRPGFHDPVTAEIPTLVMQGAVGILPRKRPRHAGLFAMRQGYRRGLSGKPRSAVR